MINLRNFLLKNYDKKIVIKLSDMEGYFADKDAYQRMLKKNPTVYKVYRKIINGIELSLTILHPGKVGKQHFMTRGHYHLKPYLELMMLLKGKGIFVEKKGKKIIKTNLEKNKVYVLLPDYAHRTVNTGNKEMEFITVQKAGAGHNYKKFKKEAMEKIIV